MENNDLEKKEKQEKLFWIIQNLGIFVLIILAVTLLIIFLTHIKEIKTDPLIYGLEKHGYTDCVCTDDDGRMWYQDNERNMFVSKKINNNFPIEFGN